MGMRSLGEGDYKGRSGVGRLFNGALRDGQNVVRIRPDGQALVPGKLSYLYVFQGLDRVPVSEVQAGEIVAIGGLEEVHIGETIGEPEHPVALPVIRVEAPTVRMTFGVNTSPFAGLEGTWGTSRKIRERLYKELEANVALRVEDTAAADTFMVSGRGELHLAILIETMRREGYEFQVSRPEVIYRAGEAGETLEPVEEVHIEVAEDHMGTVIEMLGKRRGLMTNMSQAGGSVYLTYFLPTPAP